MEGHYWILTPNPPCYYLTGGSILFRLWSSCDGQLKYMVKKKIPSTTGNNFLVAFRSIISASTTGIASLFITSLYNNWIRVCLILLLCRNSWYDDHRYRYEFL